MAKTCIYCGANLKIHNPASISVACEYCDGIMMWDEHSLKEAGKQSRLPEGYSRLYRGATGTIDNRRFQVLGRVRYQFNRGFWDEWYIIFASGEGAWITENDYQFSIQRKIDDPLFQHRPKYKMGESITIASQDFQIQEIGHASCMGIEGELPKEIHPNENYIYIDATSYDGKSCLGLELREPPTIYVGSWLEGTQIQLDDETLEW